MLRSVARVGVAVGGLYVADLWLNDDLNTLARRLRRRLPEEEAETRPRVVVLGSGFGALNLVKRLHADKFQVTVVSPQSYFAFSPLFSAAATGRVEANSIMEPLRELAARSDSGAGRISFVTAEAVSVDPKTQQVVCQDKTLPRRRCPRRGLEVTELTGAGGAAAAAGAGAGAGAGADAAGSGAPEFVCPHSGGELTLDYDYLVVAVGSQADTLGATGVAEHALFLETVRDAQAVRAQVVGCFEAASLPGVPDADVEALLHFVVVGGGPTAAKLAGNLYDHIVDDVVALYPHLKSKVRISRVEPVGEQLPLPSDIATRIKDSYSRTDVKVLAGRVGDVTAKGLTLHGDDGSSSTVATRSVLWLVGNAPRPLVAKLKSDLTLRAEAPPRALPVDGFLRVQGAYVATLFNKSAEQMFEAVLPANRLLVGKGATGTDVDDVVSGVAPFAFRGRKPLDAVLGGAAAAAAGEGDDAATGSGDESGSRWGLSPFWQYQAAFASRLLGGRNRTRVATDLVRSTVTGRSTAPA